MRGIFKFAHRGSGGFIRRFFCKRIGCYSHRKKWQGTARCGCNGMELELIAKHIQEILFGKAIVKISDSNKEISTYIIRSLTGHENLLVINAHQNAVIEGCQNSLCSQAELKRLYAKQGVWTTEDDKRIEALQRGIKRLNNILPDYENLKSKFFSIKKKIKDATKELTELQNTRHSLFINCSEYYAQEMRWKKIAYYCLQTIGGEQFWTLESFNNNTDFIFVNNVATAYINTFILSESTIREIARSPQWRYRWRGCKNGADIFGKPAAEWSEAQNALIYWSLYYDSVFEHPHVPQQIINNDSALDAWIEKDAKQREKDVLTNSNKYNKSRNKGGLQEIFVFTERGDKESIDRIQSQNDPVTRQQLRKERQILQEKGKVSEWQLRGDRYHRKDD